MTDNNKNCTEIFNDIYDKYYNKILRYFKKDFSVDDAEDLTQQTFLQLWSWIPNVQAIKNSKALIWQIAKNVRNDRFRKNAITLESYLLADKFDFVDTNNYTDLIEMRLTIQRLSVKEQQLMYLKAQGFNSEEIGKAFGISASAIRTRLQKIKRKLQL